MIPTRTAGIAWLSPELSARQTVDRYQSIALGIGLLVVVVAFLLEPLAAATLVVALLTLAFGGAVIYRLAALWSAMRGANVVVVSDVEARGIPDDALPMYTILVPAYREPEVIGALLERLSAIEYPVDKLDIRLLLEADDIETYAAAVAARPGPQFHILRITPSHPRTKPKACNVGLEDATGELVTIYDAEDIPDPLQLRRAVVAFSRLDPSVACLQAKLAYHNSDQNLLTRWFAIEYGMWFSSLLPGLVARGGPLPLGGTSNHFRRDVLARIGAWDPYNVTEDADLGIRLHRLGYRTRVLESTTFEEANSDTINWVKQRSRWYKGYLQTWLVHMRHPRELYAQLGFRGFLGFSLFVAGTPMLAILSPISWVLTVLWFLAHPPVIGALFPGWIYYPSLVLMVGGNAALYYSWIVSARMTGSSRLVKAALVSPLYFVLMSLAATKALIQLITAPSFWEKTVHGLDKLADLALADDADGATVEVKS